MENRRQLACELIKEGDVVAELGVDWGSFSNFILGHTECAKLYSIDRWAGDRKHDDKQHQDACDLLGKYGDRSEVVRATFDEALHLFEDGSLDFIYIDGYAHTGQEGGKTLDTWWNKVKPGGIMAGHDYCAKWHKTKAAVDAFAKKCGLKIHATKDADEFESWWVVKPLTSQKAYEPETREDGKVLLKGSGPPIYLDPDVAAVGSSATMLGKGYGEQIDQHAEVVRFNFAKLKGYAKDFGAKETVRYWTLTDKRLGQLYHNKPDVMRRDILEVIIHPPILISYLAIVEIIEHGDYYGRTEGTHGLSVGTIDYLKENGLKLEKPARTGLTMLIALVVSGIKPHVYGFSLKTKGTSHQAHYFRDAKVPTDGYHDVLREEAIITMMASAGLIELHGC